MGQEKWDLVRENSGTVNWARAEDKIQNGNNGKTQHCVIVCTLPLKALS
jgi:hypothetical protein